MKPEAIELLLTTARILRAKIRDEIYAEQESDLEDMNRALAPFDCADGRTDETQGDAAA
jgi:hypothetical protein